MGAEEPLKPLGAGGGVPARLGTVVLPVTPFLSCSPKIKMPGGGLRRSGGRLPPRVPEAPPREASPRRLKKNTAALPRSGCSRSASLLRSPG